MSDSSSKIFEEKIVAFHLNFVETFLPRDDDSIKVKSKELIKLNETAREITMGSLDMSLQNRMSGFGPSKKNKYVSKKFKLR